MYIHPLGMRVTSDLDCYLLLTMRLEREKRINSRRQVGRAADGFHVTVLGKDTWSPDVSPDSVKASVPVASVREDHDPDVDPDIAAVAK
jgi:hypothetical protein